MTELENLMLENADVLHRMKEEDDRYNVRRLAHEWWNWDIQPPEGYAQQVHDYIRDHPNEFRGAVPQ